ncbi:DUF6473 family protein [Haloferula sp.]|uniref:DUF6473 family protein n=1 Tax=Haloferula sp. TaxID=2497595 RepID=UPI00329D3B74
MSKTPVHLSGYQARDLEVIDYHMTELDDSGLMFRGPIPELKKDGYFTSIGAAQTLGCFCEKPYPTLLQDAIGLPALNLGYGGAGPEFFNSQQPLIDAINGGKFLILQAMSGRSQSNSVFDTGGLEYVTVRSTGDQVAAAHAWQELLLGNQTIRSIGIGKVGPAVARRLAAPKLRAVVEETRANWVNTTRELLSKVNVPVIFLWFSKRTPEYPDDHTTRGKLFGEFPHMITRSMVDDVKANCAAYVECVSDRGSPQPLFSRHTGEPCTVDPSNDRADLKRGEPWTHNTYYPSPEMNEDAYTLLEPVVREILGS